MECSTPEGEESGSTAQPLLLCLAAQMNMWRLPPLHRTEEILKEMSKLLKQKCGAGGAIKMDTCEVLLQGDHRNTVLKALVEWGHTAKKAGG